MHHLYELSKVDWRGNRPKLLPVYLAVMVRRKLTPAEFREDFGVRSFTDFDLVHDVIAYVDEAQGGDVVLAARRLLQACRDFDEALLRAGIRDPEPDEEPTVTA